nr:MAG TPA: hypothetical protein [Caudoviricetes sp.]
MQLSYIYKLKFCIFSHSYLYHSPINTIGNIISYEW